MMRDAAALSDDTQLTQGPDVTSARMPFVLHVPAATAQHPATPAMEILAS